MFKIRTSKYRHVFCDAPKQEVRVPSPTRTRDSALGERRRGLPRGGRPGRLSRRMIRKCGESSAAEIPTRSESALAAPAASVVRPLARLGRSSDTEGSAKSAEHKMTCLSTIVCGGDELGLPLLDASSRLAANGPSFCGSRLDMSCVMCSMPAKCQELVCPEIFAM